MTGCLSGLFSLRNRVKQAVDDPKQRDQQVGSTGEKAVSYGGDAATGRRRATFLGREADGSGTNELGFALEDQQVGSTGEKAVSYGGDAATGRRRATCLGRDSFGNWPYELRFVQEDLDGASSELLGKKTYKVDLEIGKPLVVKRLNYMPEKDFLGIVDSIDQVNHPNLLPLTAYYCNWDHVFLVYDYMPMGSLYSLVHVNTSGGRSPLNWDKRVNIALGVARALAHIHSKSPTTFHGNIKSSNVLLTSTFEALLSDFGHTECRSLPFVPPAIGGYQPPEVVQSNQASQKADVYSFGVLFLELLTGKDPTESYLKDEGLDLSGWMLSAVDNEWTSEVFDVEILRSENVEVLLRFLELAFTWTTRDPDMRPSMALVITQIEKLCCSSSQVTGTLTDFETG